MARTHLRRGNSGVLDEHGYRVHARCGRLVPESALVKLEILGERLEPWQVAIGCRTCRKAARSDRDKVSQTLVNIPTSDRNARSGEVRMAGSFPAFILHCTVPGCGWEKTARSYADAQAEALGHAGPHVS